MTAALHADLLEMLQSPSAPSADARRLWLGSAAMLEKGPPVSREDWTPMPLDTALERLTPTDRFAAVLLHLCRDSQADPVLIARLRDLHAAEQLWVVVDIEIQEPPGSSSTHRQTAELLTALGLTRQRSARRPAEDGTVIEQCLYRHSLHDYKPTPDWLNPRNWANPEMWDKARW